MNTKYGEYDDAQIEEYLKRIHGMVHWLLLYKERKSPRLSGYFVFVQKKVQGLSSLLNNSPDIVDLAVILEQANIEFSKGKLCDNKQYRRYIFDAHSAIDRIVSKEEVVNDV